MEARRKRLKREVLDALKVRFPDSNPQIIVIAHIISDGRCVKAESGTNSTLLAHTCSRTIQACPKTTNLPLRMYPWLFKRSCVCVCLSLCLAWGVGVCLPNHWRKSQVTLVETHTCTNTGWSGFSELVYRSLRCRDCFMHYSFRPWLCRHHQGEM